MIHVLCGASDLLQPHLSIAIAPGLARSFVRNGIPAQVLWYGPNETHGDVVFKSLNEPFEVQTTDVVLIAIPIDIYMLDKFPQLRNTTQRWLMTSCDYPGKDFSEFSVILAENEAPKLQAKYPKSKVFDYLMGCAEEISCDRATPYVNPRTVFFCGRIAITPNDWRIQDLQSLARQLPDHDFVIVSHAITPPQESIPRAFRGVALLPDPKLTQVQAAHDVSGVSFLKLPESQAVEIVNKAFASTPNVHYWGTRPWGTFWELYRHALCCLDFGFEAVGPGPNTKIIDILRSGTRLVTSGCSASYNIVRELNAGDILPYRHVKAVAETIRAISPETFNVKSDRGLDFAAKHGWTTKTRRIIESLGCEYFNAA